MPRDKRTSSGKTRAWNPKADWVVSQRIAHPALVSEADFRAAQQISAAATPQDDQPRVYALTGRLICQVCGRRLQPHWVHGHPGYRCRHGHTSAQQPDGHPRWVYWPERRVHAEVVAQLAGTGQMPAAAGVQERRAPQPTSSACPGRSPATSVTRTGLGAPLNTYRKHGFVADGTAQVEGGVREIRMVRVMRNSR